MAIQERSLYVGGCDIMAWRYSWRLFLAARTEQTGKGVILVSIYEQSISATTTIFCQRFFASDLELNMCLDLLLCSSRAQKLLTNKRAVVGGHQGCGYNLPVTHA